MLVCINSTRAISRRATPKRANLSRLGLVDIEDYRAVAALKPDDRLPTPAAV